MRKEYQEIVESARITFDFSPREQEQAQWVAERCQALADKPPKMLTLEEIEVVCKECLGCSEIIFAKAIQSAFIAKQKEPETRKVKILVYDNGGDIFVSTAYAEGMRLLKMIEEEVTL